MRILALIGAAAAAGTAVAYLIVLFKQGGPIGWPTVGLVLAMMAALAGLTAYGAWGPIPERRAMALWAAVPGFFGLGLLAAWSIGGLLLLGGIPTLAAAGLAMRGVTIRPGPAAAFLAAAVVAWAAGLGLLLVLAQAGSTG